MRIQVPETNKAPAAVVDLDEDGTVRLDGKVIGTVSGDGSYSYSPKAAGHGGRIARYHTEVREWQAKAAGTERDGYYYRGGIYPSHYRKNTRKGALAYLVAVEHGVDAVDAGYFYWHRTDRQWAVA